MKQLNNFGSAQFFQRKIVVWFGALICCFLWGSAFPFIKIGYEQFQIAGSATASQILFAGIRFTLAGILAVILGSVIQHRVIVPKKGEWKDVLWLSLFQTILQYFFFYVGLAHTTGVKASIIEGVNVFVAIFVSACIFHLEKVTLRKILGSIVGFAGVVLVNLTGQEGEWSLSFLGDGFIFISTVAYACSSVILKKLSVREDPVMLSGYQFIAGGVIMTVGGLLFGGSLTVWTLPGVLVLLYLAFVSAVAYSLWGILLKHNPVSMVAVFGFMNPVFGVILSAILLSEASSLGIGCVAALALVCTGIFIVNRKKV